LFSSLYVTVTFGGLIIPAATNNCSKLTVASFFSSTITAFMFFATKAFDVEPFPIPTNPFCTTGKRLRDNCTSTFILARCASISGVGLSFLANTFAFAMFLHLV